MRCSISQQPHMEINFQCTRSSSFLIRYKIILLLRVSWTIKCIFFYFLNPCCKNTKHTSLMDWLLTFKYVFCISAAIMSKSLSTAKRKLMWMLSLLTALEYIMTDRERVSEMTSSNILCFLAKIMFEMQGIMQGINVIQFCSSHAMWGNQPYSYEYLVEVVCQADVRPGTVSINKPLLALTIVRFGSHQSNLLTTLINIMVRSREKEWLHERPHLLQK